MRVLGEATGVTSAHVFENVSCRRPRRRTRAGLAAGNRAEAISDGRRPSARTSPARAPFPALGRGARPRRRRQRPLRDLPEEEREALALAGSLSVLAVPIFVKGRWWGFIGFEDAEHRARLEPRRDRALRAAAGIVAAAIKRESAEGDLRRRDAVLEAVSHGAQRLVAAPNWRDAAPGFLQELGEASGASRSYLFENGIREDGRQIVSQRFEWADAGHGAPTRQPGHAGHVLRGGRTGGVAELGARNEVFTGKVKDMPAASESSSREQAIKSLMVVPIFVGGEWWGFIGFDDCVTERKWSPAEIDALRTSSEPDRRGDRARALRGDAPRAEQKLRAVFDTALDAIFITDDDRRYVDVNPAGMRVLRRREARPDRPLARRVPAAARGSQRWRGLGGVPRRAAPILRRMGDASGRRHAPGRGGLCTTELPPRPHIAFLRDITDAEAARGGAAERTEAREPRPARGRRRARLQQPAHRHHRLRARCGSSGRPTTSSLPRLGELMRAADRAAELTQQLLAFGRRQVLDRAPLDLNAVVAELGASQRAARRPTSSSNPAPRPLLAPPASIRASSWTCSPVSSSTRRDAMPEGGTLTIARRDAERGFVELVRHRHRLRDGRRDPRPGLRAVLHDARGGRRPRPRLGLRHRPAERRRRHSSRALRARLHLHRPAAARARARQPAPPAASPRGTRAPRRSCSSRTRTSSVDLTRRVLERQGYTVLACADGHASGRPRRAERSPDRSAADRRRDARHARLRTSPKRVAGTRPTIKSSTCPVTRRRRSSANPPLPRTR